MTSASSRARYRQFVDAYRRELWPFAQLAAWRARRGADAQHSAAPTKPVGRRRTPPAAPVYLSTYLSVLRGHRVAIASILALGLGASAIEMTEPLLARYIIDHIMLNTRAAAAARVRALNLAGALFGLVVLTAGLLGALKTYRQKRLNARVTLSLRRKLFERVLALPLSRLSETSTGGIMSRLAGDVDTTSGFLQLALFGPAVSLVRLAMAVSVLLTLNWRLALAAIAIMPLLALVSGTSSQRVRPIYRSIRRDIEASDGRAAEAFLGVRVVRSFRQEKTELMSYLRGRHLVLRKELFAQRRDLVLVTMWGLLMGGVNVVIIWYGGRLGISGRTTVGDIMAFQWYAHFLLAPVLQIVNTLSELQRALAAVERVCDMLAMPTDKPDRPDARPAPRVVRSLRFDTISFEYRPGEPAISDFDLVVPAGATVALVGKSGAGKTTIMDLLARFQDPTRGRILINGSDIREFQVLSYRRLLAVVHQNVFLFAGSVRDNIAYGRWHASDAEIERAARRANAHEFIERLPERYDTIVGERGTTLSGGQCQRLAIARAFLAEPQILILDEATSSLDTESELWIQSAVRALVRGRTTFVVAHRLSTVRLADLIVLIEDGRIVERGTHNALMALRGRYYRMVLRQTGGELWADSEGTTTQEAAADDAYRA